MSKNKNIAKFDLSQHLHPAWSVDDFFITLNDDMIMNPATILTFETLFTGKRTHGVYSYRDTANMFETHNLSIGGKITVEHTSQKGSKKGPEVEYKQNFTITRVTSSDINSERIVTVEFEDTLTYQLSNSYTNAKFDETLPMDMYKELLGVAAEGITFVDSILGMPEAKALFSTGDSALKNLTTDFAHRGFNLVQDKLNTFIVHDDQMTCDKLKSTGEFFSCLQKPEFSRFNIIDYEIGSIDYEVLNSVSTTRTNNIEPELIGNEKISVKTTPAPPNCGGELSKSTNIIDMLRGEGQKQSNGKSFANAATLTKNMKNAQTLIIWVPGCNNEKLHKTIEVEIPNPKGHDTTRGDENMSGVWEIWQVRDKIISSIFIQQLFLRRGGS